MRTHPQVGYDLLSGQPRFAAAELVLCHHEVRRERLPARAARRRDFAGGALTVADA